MGREVVQPASHGARFLLTRSGHKAEVRFGLHSLKLPYFWGGKKKKRACSALIIIFFLPFPKYACVGSPQQTKVVTYGTSELNNNFFFHIREDFTLFNPMYHSCSFSLERC